MSTDASDLAAAVLEWGNRAAGQALDGLRQRVRDTRFPFGVYETDTDFVHLADSEEAVVLTEGEQWAGTLAYTADHASYLDEGTDPHEIVGNPLLAFQWGEQLVIVHSVQHPGSHRHDGWFSQVVTDEAWAEELDRALTETPVP